MDPIEEWSRAQERVIALVEAGDPGLRVPSCPDWTVRDLFSHMVGLGADVVAGDEPDDHNERWTSAQVAKRRDRTVAELVAEWREIAEPLRETMRRTGPRPLGDVVIHEQDLRGALGVSGGQDTPGLAAIRDRFAGRFAERLPAGASLALAGDAWSWGDPAAETVLRASDFELARALMTRRSAAQLRSWTVRGDVTPHLAAFESLGTLPEKDLQE